MLIVLLKVVHKYKISFRDMFISILHSKFCKVHSFFLKRNINNLFFLLLLFMEFENFINQQLPRSPNEISGLTNRLPPDQSDLNGMPFHISQFQQ